MKIKILYLSCLILIFALSLLSCGGGTKNSPTASNSDNLQPPSIGSAEDAIELIRNNSSIKSMPNDSYRSVETDGFDIKEENGTFILASEAMGIEYIFSGGATLEECALASLTIKQPGYAIFGITVGGRASDAKTVFTSFGFEKDSRDGTDIYSYKGVIITVGSIDKTITYITIGS